MTEFEKFPSTEPKKGEEPVLGEISKMVWGFESGNRITKAQADLLAALLQRHAVAKDMHQYKQEIDSILRDEYPDTIHDPNVIFTEGYQDPEEGFYYQVEDPNVSYVGPFDLLTQVEDRMVLAMDEKIHSAIDEG